MNRPIRLALAATTALSLLMLGLAYTNAQEEKPRPRTGSEVNERANESNCDQQDCDHQDCDHENCDHHMCGGQDGGGCGQGDGNCDPDNCPHEDCDHQNCDHHMCGGHHGGGHGDGCGGHGARGGDLGWAEAIEGAQYTVINAPNGVIITITSGDPLVVAEIQARYAKHPRWKQPARDDKLSPNVEPGDCGSEYCEHDNCTGDCDADQCMDDGGHHGGGHGDHGGHGGGCRG